MYTLITGGAGYIGSFMTKKLLDEGHQVVVADSLENGHKEVLDSRALLRVGNLLDKLFVKDLFDSYKFSSVLNFAGYISMAESVRDPQKYMQNNVQSAVNLLDEMVNHEVSNFVFSSTAGVYGNPEKVPIPEDHPKNPTNPYGESKLAVEELLHNYKKSLQFTVLRYFNAAGAALDGSMGENHPEETHIIPNVIRAILKDEEFPLYGTDYETKDGTAVRDYIHVLDLVEAHMLALKKMETEKTSSIYNVGTGIGFSNKEVIDTVSRIASVSVKVKEMPRRPGDADVLIADPTRINKDLGFVPQYSSLETIVSSAWSWHRNKNEK
jgi:UDP-glucose 4-epimerase